MMAAEFYSVERFINMKPVFLDFEQPIAELTNKIDELRFVQGESAVDISDEIARLQKKSNDLTKSIFSKLTPAQISQVSRHPQRPYTYDYINTLFTDFEELHGDRHYADDHAIVGGLARFNGQSVVVVGHQKGRDTKEKIRRNFGMPIMTFVDTPGAYPGIGAEERGQSEAIGRNLYELTRLRVPILCTIIGEGGSGGALAIAVGDYVNMLQYSTYSVISPEGCASILWKTAEKAADAAQALGITAKRLLDLGLIDRIINEPLGGAHRDMQTAMKNVKAVLEEQLREAQSIPMADLLSRRFDRIMAYGQFTEK